MCSLLSVYSVQVHTIDKKIEKITKTLGFGKFCSFSVFEASFNKKTAIVAEKSNKQRNLFLLNALNILIYELNQHFDKKQKLQKKLKA